MDNSDTSKTAAKKALRRQLLEQRLNLPDRLEQADLLQQVMRIWLVGRPDTVIGAYWPIKGEFDPLPALHRWKEDGELLDQPQRRRIGLPVVNKEHKASPPPHYGLRCSPSTLSTLVPRKWELGLFPFPSSSGIFIASTCIRAFHRWSRSPCCPM
jgi:5-formyltetrahydrofolate cyclo-ligase